MSEFVKVPYLDLQAHHAPHRGEFLKAIEQVMDEGAFAGGSYVEAFEKDFAEFCQTSDAVGVSSGTDALWLALSGLGIGPGDEVITAPMTFVATVEAIIRTGARPVFADIDESSYTLNPRNLEAALTKRTKAIVPVHLFGRVADMEPILRFASEHGLSVVEDAAQAHGALYRERRAGSLADAGCFSFYPGKNLGAFGDAGAVTTNHPELAEHMRRVRNHGQSRKYHHDLPGWNSRMDGIQAAVLRIKLRELDRNNRLRQGIAERYQQEFEGLEACGIPSLGKPGEHVHHIYALRVKDRNEFIKSLNNKGVECGIHYPVPVHLQTAFSSLGHRPGSFPVSEQVANEFVSLPIYPELSEAQIEAIVSSVKAAVTPSVLA